MNIENESIQPFPTLEFSNKTCLKKTILSFSRLLLSDDDLWRKMTVHEWRSNAATAESNDTAV